MNTVKNNPNKSASIYNGNVELYDIAFDWDISDEVTWLLARLGNGCKTILEPGCGSGRMLEAIAKRGIRITGFDISPAAVAFAQKRIMSLNNASAVIGDMVSFDLGKTFDGAICPVNTLAHLTPEQLALHLQCMGRHVHQGAKYLIQIALRNHDEPNHAGNAIVWEACRGQIHLRMSVSVEEFDRVASRELHRFRIEILQGSRAGETIDETHWMTSWTPDYWQMLINASPFTQFAQYDGDLNERPTVKIGQPGNLMWHELIRRY